MNMTTNESQTTIAGNFAFAPEPSLTDSEVQELRDQIGEIAWALRRAKDGIDDAREAVDQAHVLLGVLQSRDATYSLNSFASSLSEAEDGICDAGDSLDRAASAAEDALSEIDFVDTVGDTEEASDGDDNDTADDNEARDNALNTTSEATADLNPASSQIEQPLPTVVTSAGIVNEEEAP
jgi:hypothetical protein